MVRASAVAVILLASAGLAGCSGDTPGDIGTLWGGESSADRERREAEQRRRTNKVPMQSVRTVEVGRTSDGILLSAFGTAPGPGFSLPALRVRRNGQPASDGYLEFDLVASEQPAGAELPPANAQNVRIRADLPIELRALRGVQGLRVMALSGQIQIDF